MSHMDSMERLKAWLTHKGFTVVRRAGRDIVRVERRKHGPIKLYLTLTAAGWSANGDRKSHHCARLNEAIREFNDAERIISGREGDLLDASSRRRIDAMPDHEVQEMADFYASQPALTLECIGQARPSFVGSKPFVMYPTLSSIVSAMRYREMILAEPARRDRQFARLECAS
jgi:hypothetical protein